MIIINSSNTHTFNTLPVNAGIIHAPRIKVDTISSAPFDFVVVKKQLHSAMNQPSTFIPGTFTSVLNKGIRIRLCTHNPLYNTSPLVFTHTNVFCL